VGMCVCVQISMFCVFLYYTGVGMWVCVCVCVWVGGSTCSKLYVLWVYRVHLCKFIPVCFASLRLAMRRVQGINEFIRLGYAVKSWPLIADLNIK